MAKRLAHSATGEKRPSSRVDWKMKAAGGAWRRSRHQGRQAKAEPRTGDGIVRNWRSQRPMGRQAQASIS